MCSSDLEVAVSVTVDDARNLETIIAELSQLGTIETESNQTIVCIVGNMLSEKEGVLGQVFAALKDVPVKLVSFGGSPNNISLLIDTTLKEKTLKLLNSGLFGLE
mgnify:FL=1